MVTVGQERVKQFLQAELAYFAQRQPKPVSLSKIVAASEPEQVARLLFDELPVLFAARIRHIESLKDWEKHEPLVELRKIFYQSFSNLRLTEMGTDDLSTLTQVVANLRERHRKVTPLLSEVFRDIYADKDEEEERRLNQWAEAFMKSRISTEMLTAHFAASAAATDAAAAAAAEQGAPQQPQERAQRPGCIGIVDTRCDPGEICELAAREAVKPYDGVEGFEDLVIQVQKPKNKIEFSYIPQYLRYIVQELLQNSIRATLDVAAHRNDAQRRPIQVKIAADQQQVAICISDKGGGLPTGYADRVWSYAFSTASRRCHIQGRSPLSGRGLGLPLSRLYAGYLGGSFEVMNVTGVGVDAYLFLNRIDPFDSNETPGGRPLSGL